MQSKDDSDIESWSSVFVYGRSWMRTSSPSSKNRKLAIDDARSPDTAMSFAKRSLLLSLPTELLALIFNPLLPLDILSLVHTHHAMRDFLLHPSSKRVWDQARKNLVEIDSMAGYFPEWVTDMHEARYVRYVWVKLCQMCGTDAPFRPEMPFIRIRLCEQCTEQYCIDGTIAQSLLPKKDLDLLQSYSFPKSTKRMYFRPAVLDLKKHLQNLASNAGELDAFRERKKEVREDAADHARELKDWFDDWNGHERYQMGKLRAARLREVHRRLLDSEFSYMDVSWPDFEAQHLADITEPFTDSTWNMILAQMSPSLTKRKRERLARHIKYAVVRCLDKYFRTLNQSARDTFPPLPDILAFPSVKPLLKLGDADSKDIRKAFKNAFGSLLEDIARFQKKMRHDLWRIWEEGKHVLADQDLDASDGYADSECETVHDSDSDWDDSDSTGEDPVLWNLRQLERRGLDRATTVFRCRLFCKDKPIHASSPYHKCLRDEGWSKRLPSTEMEVTPWHVHLSKLVVNRDDPWIIEELIDAAGLHHYAHPRKLDECGKGFRYWIDTLDGKGKVIGRIRSPLVDWKEAYVAKRRDWDYMNGNVYGLPSTKAGAGGDEQKEANEDDYDEEDDAYESSFVFDPEGFTLDSN